MTPDLNEYIVEVYRPYTPQKGKKELIPSVDHDLPVWAKDEEQALKIARRRVEVVYPGAKCSVRGKAVS